MKIKNYTSTVPAEASIMKIEKALVAMGARDIMKTYDGSGKTCSIRFVLLVNGGPVLYDLPSDTEAVYRVLKSTKGIENRYKNREQAERTGWKLVHDWVLAQLSFVQLEQAKATQVFLPFAMVQTKEGHVPLYEMIENYPNAFALAETND